VTHQDHDGLDAMKPHLIYGRSLGKGKINLRVKSTLENLIQMLLAAK
jgi:hypothetical protein